MKTEQIQQHAKKIAELLDEGKLDEARSTFQAIVKEKSLLLRQATVLSDLVHKLRKT